MDSSIPHADAATTIDAQYDAVKNLYINAGGFNAPDEVDALNNLSNDDKQRIILRHGNIEKKAKTFMDELEKVKAEFLELQGGNFTTRELIEKYQGRFGLPQNVDPKNNKMADALSQHILLQIKNQTFGELARKIQEEIGDINVNPNQEQRKLLRDISLADYYGNDIEVKYLMSVYKQIESLFNPNGTLEALNQVMAMNLDQELKHGLTADEAKQRIKQAQDLVPWAYAANMERLRGTRPDKEWKKKLRDLELDLEDYLAPGANGGPSVYDTIRGNLNQLQTLPAQIEFGLIELESIPQFELTRDQLNTTGNANLDRLQAALVALDRAINDQNTTDADVQRYRALRGQMERYINQVTDNEAFANFQVNVPILPNDDYVNNLARNLNEFRGRYNPRREYANQPDHEAFGDVVEARRFEVNRDLFLANVLMGEGITLGYVDQDPRNEEEANLINAAHGAARDYLETTEYQPLMARYAELQAEINRRRGQNVVLTLFNGTRTADLETEFRDVEAHIRNIHLEILNRYAVNFARGRRGGYEDAILNHPDNEYLALNFNNVNNRYGRQVGNNPYLIVDVPDEYAQHAANFNARARRLFEFRANHNLQGRVRGNFERYIDTYDENDRVVPGRATRFERRVNRDREQAEDNVNFNQFDVNNIADDDLAEAFQTYNGQLRTRQNFIRDRINGVPEDQTPDGRDVEFEINIERARIRANRNLARRTAQTNQEINFIPYSTAAKETMQYERLNPEQRNRMVASREVMRQAYAASPIPGLLNERDALQNQLEQMRGRVIITMPGTESKEQRIQRMENDLEALNAEIQDAEDNFDRVYSDKFIRGRTNDVLRNHPDLLAINEDSLVQIERALYSLSEDELLVTTGDTQEMREVFGNAVRLNAARQRLTDFAEQFNLAPDAFLTRNHLERLNRAEALYNNYGDRIRAIGRNRDFYDFRVQQEGELTPESIEITRAMYAKYSEADEQMTNLLVRLNQEGSLSQEVADRVNGRHREVYLQMLNFNRLMLAQNPNDPDIVSKLVGDAGTIGNLGMQLSIANRDYVIDEEKFILTGDAGDYNKVLKNLELSRQMFARMGPGGDDPRGPAGLGEQGRQRLIAQRADLEQRRARYRDLDNQLSRIMSGDTRQYRYNQNKAAVDNILDQMEQVLPGSRQRILGNYRINQAA